MLDDFSVKGFQVLIRPCKNISKIFHKAGIPVSLLIWKCFGYLDDIGICSCPNITVYNLLFLNFNCSFPRDIITVKNPLHWD
jgi:hypothetical protein